MFVATAAILLLASAGALAAGNSTDTKVQLVVYYETLCPDSQKFITTQFVPLWDQSSNYLNVTLVPYGKSTMDTVNGTDTFTCHHGPDECYGNKVQACILDENTSHLMMNEQIKLINCLMKEGKKNVTYPTMECAKKNQIADSAVTAIETCVNSTKGDELLKALGQKTDAFLKPLANVPTVTLNGVQNKEAVSNLLGSVCGLISSNKPASCPSKNSATTLLTYSLLPVVTALALAKL